MSLADWLHCHLPQGGVSGHVGTAEAFEFITLINIYSHYARAIRSHHVSDTFEQVNKFHFRFSGFPSQRLGYQPQDGNVHVESCNVAYFCPPVSSHHVCVLLTGWLYTYGDLSDATRIISTWFCGGETFFKKMPFFI